VNILALGAHPDDIEYGCGGLLLLAARANHRVFLNVLTDGSGVASLDRRKEQEQSAALLGAEALIWGGFQDTRLTANRDLIVAIEETIEKVEPDMVLVNAPLDAHQDHKALASSAVTACRYVRRVLFYQDYTSLDFQPDTFADIGTVLEEKKKLLACHASQVNKKYPTGLDMLESVDALATYHGFMAKVKYAEGFKPLRNLLGMCG
jgi:LmbE family N-acetylglucosaminyl deacetylase